MSNSDALNQILKCLNTQTPNRFVFKSQITIIDNARSVFNSCCFFFNILHREKLPSLNDEDSHFSLAVTALTAANSTAAAVPMVTSLPSDGAAGVTSPPCVVTPLDHDYAKRKKLQQRQGQPQDGTVHLAWSLYSLTHSLTWG